MKVVTNRHKKLKRETHHSLHFSITAYAISKLDKIYSTAKEYMEAYSANPVTALPWKPKAPTPSQHFHDSQNPSEYPLAKRQELKAKRATSREQKS
jgi:hypothetical protein